MIILEIPKYLTKETLEEERKEKFSILFFIMFLEFLIAGSILAHFSKFHEIKYERTNSELLLEEKNYTKQKITSYLLHMVKTILS